MLTVIACLDLESLKEFYDSALSEYVMTPQEKRLHLQFFITHVQVGQNLA